MVAIKTIFYYVRLALSLTFLLSILNFWMDSFNLLVTANTNTHGTNIVIWQVDKLWCWENVLGCWWVVPYRRSETIFNRKFIVCPYRVKILVGIIDRCHLTKRRTNSTWDLENCLNYTKLFQFNVRFYLETQTIIRKRRTEIYLET